MHDAADQFVQHLFDLYGPIAVFGLLVIAGVGLHLPEDLIVIPATVTVFRTIEDGWSWVTCEQMKRLFADSNWKVPVALRRKSQPRTRRWRIVVTWDLMSRHLLPKKLLKSSCLIPVNRET